MEWSNFTKGMDTTQGLVSLYRLKSGDAGHTVEIDARYSPEPAWKPPVVQSFATREKAQDFAEKFETAMARLSAKQGYFDATKNGIFARLNSEGKPVLVSTAPGKPEVPFRDIDLDVSKIWYGKTLKGLVADGDRPIQMGTRSIFDDKAKLARDAALDAMVLESALTLQSAAGLLNRAIARNPGDHTHGGQRQLGKEMTTAGQEGQALLTGGVGHFLASDAAGNVTSTPCRLVYPKDTAKPGSTLRRIELTGQAEVLTKPKLIEFMEIASNPNSGIRGSDFRTYSEVVAHVVQNDQQATFNPKSNLALIEEPGRRGGPTVRFDAKPGLQKTAG